MVEFVRVLFPNNSRVLPQTLGPMSICNAMGVRRAKDNMQTASLILKYSIISVTQAKCCLHLCTLGANNNNNAMLIAKQLGRVRQLTTMSRQSSRIKVKETQTGPSKYAEDQASDDDNATSKRKRKKTDIPQPVDSSSTRPAKRFRKKRGVLERLVEMPMDILFEIFGNLGPMDVLHLARTAKPLRAILMSRSSILIWKQACLNVPHLPPCPEDLAEPQWVDLALGKNCQVCLRNQPSQVISWLGRIRGCVKCVHGDFEISHSYAYKDTIANGLLPLIPSITIEKGARSSLGTWYQQKAYNRIRESLGQYDQYSQAGRDWIHQQLEENKSLIEHAKQCAVWLERQNRVRAENLEAARNERKNVILGKLEEQEWQAEVEYLLLDDEFWSRPALVSILKKDVTDRIWSSAQEAVVEIVQDFSRARIENEHKETIKSRNQLIVEFHKAYANTRPIEEVIIPAGDLFSAREIQEIFNAPFERSLTLADFEAVMPLTPEISRRWETSAKQKLLQMIRSELPPEQQSDELSEGHLELATSVFKCSKCCRTMRYNRALAHRCARTLSWMPPDLVIEPGVQKFMTQTQQCPWSLKGIFSFQSTTSARIAKLVLMAKGDPKTSTVADMDAIDPVFECERCISYTDGRCMLNWSGAAIHHCAAEHLKLVVDEATVAAVKSGISEKIRHNKASFLYAEKLVCTHCRRRGHSGVLREHLKRDHNVTDLNNVNEHIVEDPDAPATEIAYNYWCFDPNSKY